MKIFTASQIRACDDFTIENEPISSINLMERAAQKCADYINSHFLKIYTKKETIFGFLCFMLLFCLRISFLRNKSYKLFQ